MTILSKDNCDKISAIFIQLFKSKLSLARSAPNAILLNRWIYNYRDLYGIQLQAKLSNFLIALNHKSLLGQVTYIRLLQIQSKYNLDRNPVVSWPLDFLANRHNVTFLEGLLTLCKKHSLSYSVPDSQLNVILGGHTPIRSIVNQQVFTRLKNFLAKYRIIYKSQLSELLTDRPLSWPSFCQANGRLVTIAPAAWFTLLQATFPGQPIFSESSPFRLNPAPIPDSSLSAYNPNSLPAVHQYCTPLDLPSLHQHFWATPKAKRIFWAVTWSPFISSPIIVKISLGTTDWSSLNYTIEHWVVTPSTLELRELVAASTNYDFLVPCTQPGCLTSSPTQDQFATIPCAVLGSSPLQALALTDIHAIHRHPDIYYSKLKSQTIFNSFITFLIGTSLLQPPPPPSNISTSSMDLLSANPSLSATITSISSTL